MFADCLFVWWSLFILYSHANQDFTSCQFESSVNRNSKPNCMSGCCLYPVSMNSFFICERTHSRQIVKHKNTQRETERKTNAKATAVCTFYSWVCFDSIWLLLWSLFMASFYLIRMPLFQYNEREHQSISAQPSANTQMDTQRVEHNIHTLHMKRTT